MALSGLKFWQARATEVKNSNLVSFVSWKDVSLGGEVEAETGFCHLYPLQKVQHTTAVASGLPSEKNATISPELEVWLLERSVQFNHVIPYFQAKLFCLATRQASGSTSGAGMKGKAGSWFRRDRHLESPSFISGEKLTQLWLHQCTSRLPSGEGVELRQSISNRLVSPDPPEHDLSFSGASGGVVVYTRAVSPSNQEWAAQALLSIQFKELTDLKISHPLASVVMYHKAVTNKRSSNTISFI